MTRKKPGPTVVLPVISSEHSGPKTRAFFAQPSMLGLKLLHMTLKWLTSSEHQSSHYDIMAAGVHALIIHTFAD